MSDSLVGRKVGHYELREIIGRGGMAVVYRAAQPRIERDVAIKIIAAPYARQPAFVRRFEQEMRATVRLQHPHILPVYDVNLEDSQPYMVMAYLPGGTLSRRIADAPGGLPIDFAICVTSQVAAALDYAHGQGIVHRDVKPGNILLDSHDNAYLGDFGIAQVAQEQATPPLGTFAYMAPELLAGQPATPASDIYSLGVVAFEMLAGTRPFEAHDRATLLALRELTSIPDIRRRRPDLPQGLQVVLTQALTDDPAGRPPHASSLAQALLRASGLSGLPCVDSAEDFDEIDDFDDSDLPVSAWPDDDDEDDEPVERYDPRTPPPFADLGWMPDGPDTDEPERPAEAPPVLNAPATEIPMPTAAAPAGAGRSDRGNVSLGPALLLIWAGAVLVLLGLAVLAVVLISRAGGPPA